MPKELINYKDSKFIFDTLLNNDGDSRFVGGCVRDMLLKLPINDIDIGTTLVPDEIENIFKQFHDVKVLDVGKEYGTIMVVMNGTAYEITTLRKDISTDGRHAIVEYSTDWKEDAERRDFTINGMSYDPYEHKLYDYFGGQEDLSRRLIKFIGNPEQRIKEDYLRILRLFRIYTYYGKIIDIPSLDACKKLSPHVASLSRERKMNELFRIIKHTDYIETLTLMLECGVLKHVSEYPIWDDGISLCHKLEELSATYQHTIPTILKIFTLFRKNTSAHAKEITNEFITLLKEEKKHIAALFKLVNTASLRDVEDNTHHFLYYYKDVLLDGLLYLLVTQDNFKPTKHHTTFNKIKKLVSQPIPSFPLTASDIMKSHKVTPGKKLGELLNTAKNFWIKSKFKASKEEIKKYLLNILS